MIGCMASLEERSQLDLFAWRGPAGDRGTPASGAAKPLRARLPEAQNIPGMAAADLLGALDACLEATVPSGLQVTDLIAELGRRGETGATDRLVAVCRRHAGFDSRRTVPEVVAALRALALIKSPAPAPAILRLVEQGAFGPESMAAALRYFAAQCYRPAASLLDQAFTHESAQLRLTACEFAAAVGTYGRREALRALRQDNDAAVAEAALLALGRLGDRAVKNDLEDRLRLAEPEAIPKVVESLAALADEETAILLGRLAESCSDQAACLALVRALAELDAATALPWLLRLAADPSPEIRRTVVAGLAGHDDPRRAPALRQLAEDDDPNVRRDAQEALRGDPSAP